jgi:protein-tyrosine phosphatase
MQTVPRSILFVCTGNICRSPLAEGVFRDLAVSMGCRDLLLDSAGLGSWHLGEPPDARSIKVGARHGVAIHTQVCRMVSGADFANFDVILGMDRSHVHALEQQRPQGAIAHVRLYMDWCTGRMQDVPDPFYGDLGDFEKVYGMVRSAAENWFATAGFASSGQDSSIT